VLLGLPSPLRLSTRGVLTVGSLVALPSSYLHSLCLLSYSSLVGRPAGNPYNGGKQSRGGGKRGFVHVDVGGRQTFPCFASSVLVFTALFPRSFVPPFPCLLSSFPPPYPSTQMSTEQAKKLTRGVLHRARSYGMQRWASLGGAPELCLQFGNKRTWEVM
jgi:hypothetical protein